MIMRIKLEPDAIMPERAHETDAGLDLFSRETVTIRPWSRAFFDTGVHIELPPDTVGKVESKSGLNRKHGLFCTGTIDEPYTGCIGVTLFNNSCELYTVHAGDKIAQLVIYPILKPTLMQVDELKETDRGSGGFGSTGKRAKSCGNCRHKDEQDGHRCFGCRMTAKGPTNWETDKTESAAI